MNTKKIYLGIISLLAFISAQAQDISLKASLDTNKITIGDQTHLQIQLIQPKSKTVVWPIITDTFSKNIEIIRKAKFDTIDLGGGKISVKTNYLITSFDSGSFIIPAMEFKYDIINDSTFSKSATNALILNVNTLPVDTTKAFKDIKGIIGEPYTLGEILRVVIPIILVIGLIIFGIYAYRRHKANKPIFNLFTKPLPPADVEAISSLNELKEKSLWQNNAIKTYYSELTNIMRRYIERRYDFPAQEMVSNEIVGSLNNENIAKELIEKTEEILQTSDLVKFAKFEPLGNVNDAALKWAYHFVNSTKETIEDKEAEK